MPLQSENMFNVFVCSDFVVDQTQAVKFALDIACGMAFLHTLEPMIPRHYLNSKSVMVSAVESSAHRDGGGKSYYSERGDDDDDNIQLCAHP